jgi:hypothetical protein
LQLGPYVQKNGSILPLFTNVSKVLVCPKSNFTNFDKVHLKSIPNIKEQKFLSSVSHSLTHLPVPHPLFVPLTLLALSLELQNFHWCRTTHIMAWPRNKLYIPLQRTGMFASTK